ncbi:MAG: citramalate synthase [Christensenella sp.]|nr:citramalate synthase [Christensenella sp.]
MNEKIDTFDSTLRDGMQGEGIAFSVEDKLNIVRALDSLGIDFIEAGNPGSNPKDLEFFRRLRGNAPAHAKLCAFGSTRRKGIRPEDDGNVNSLLEADTPAVAIFGKAWDLHVDKVIHATLQENLEMIESTVAYMKRHGKYVVFDAEHFFDGYAANAAYAMQALCAAHKGGADVLCLCDTNGAAFPTAVQRITAEVAAAFPDVKIGIHCHNDMGMAVAQTMLAVEAGARQVQGTFIGYGERCGNANLSTVIPNLELKCGYDLIGAENMKRLTETARRIADISNIWLPASSPYVGASAFAHKGGMHIDGVKKIRKSFEHVSPETVGNNRRFLMSEVSGKATLLKKIQRIDPSVTAADPVVGELVDRLKQLEFEGYQFEAAEQSFELVIRRLLGKYKKYFELEYFKIIGEQPLYNQEYPSSAIIKVKVGEESRVTGAEGDGPVHAIDLALRKALKGFYPSLEKMSLVDYKVRVLESSATTAAKVRVLIESTDGKNAWNTVGVSTDIIEASFRALADSIEYKLTLDEA